MLMRCVFLETCSVEFRRKRVESKGNKFERNRGKGRGERVQRKVKVDKGMVVKERKQGHN